MQSLERVGFFEAVASAGDGEEPLVGTPAQLQANAPDMDFDGLQAPVRRRFDAPYVAVKRFPVLGLRRLEGELIQELEFFRRQMREFFLAQGYRFCVVFQREIADSYRRGVLGPRGLSAPKQRAASGDKPVGFYGFGEVVVCAHVQTGDILAVFIFPGQYQYRYARRLSVLLQGLADVQSRHAGENQIEQNHIGGRVLRPARAQFARGGGRDFETLVAKDVRYGFSKSGVVFYD